MATLLQLGRPLFTVQRGEVRRIACLLLWLCIVQLMRMCGCVGSRRSVAARDSTRDVAIYLSNVQVSDGTKEAHARPWVRNSSSSYSRPLILFLVYSKAEKKMALTTHERLIETPMPLYMRGLKN